MPPEPRGSQAAATAARYDVVALVSNDLVTDQRMQRTLASLCAIGLRCLLLGRERTGSRALDLAQPFAQERHRLRHERGKRFYLELHRAHRRRLLRLRPRLIIGVDLDTAAAAALAARQLGIPWVFDAHELFEEMPEVARRPWIKAAWFLWGKRWVPSAAGAYTVGAELAAILSQRYGLPFGVVRNFPPSGQTSVPPPTEASVVLPARLPDDFVVLYQGALNEGRGVEELIEAAAQLPGVVVWIAGDGPERQRLCDLARARPTARVHFLGELRPDELRRVTPLADLGYALMRRVSKNYYLSLSNKSIDYVHAGVPSLQMDWPEYARLQAQHGCYHLVAHLSVAAVVTAIEACRSPEYLRQLALACERAAPDLSWEREAEVMVALVEAARDGVEGLGHASRS